MLWLRNKKYLFIFIQTSLLSLLPVLCAEEIPTQSVFSPWPSSVARVKEVGTTTWRCAGLKGTSLHTPVLVIHAWSVSHSHPSGHLGRSSGPGSILFVCLFYPKSGESGKSRALLGVVEPLLVLPCHGGTLPAPAVIRSLSQHKILLLGLEYGHANFIFSLN